MSLQDRIAAAENAKRITPDTARLLRCWIEADGKGGERFAVPPGRPALLVREVLGPDVPLVKRREPSERPNKNRLAAARPFGAAEEKIGASKEEAATEQDGKTKLAPTQPKTARPGAARSRSAHAWARKNSTAAATVLARHPGVTSSSPTMRPKARTLMS